MASFFNLQFVKKCFGLRFSLQPMTLIGNSQKVVFGAMTFGTVTLSTMPVRKSIKICDI